MEENLKTVLDMLSNMSIWAVCLFLAAMAVLQYIFPPVPSDTLLLALGVLVHAKTFLGPEVFFSYSLASIIGAAVFYEVCYKLGDKVFKIKFIKKSIDIEKLKKSREKVEKYGGVSYFFLRFVPSMQIVTLITFGLLKLKRSSAYFNIVAVGILANFVYYIIGYLLGRNIPRLIYVLNIIGNAGWIIFGIILAAVIIFIIYRLKKRKE